MWGSNAVDLHDRRWATRRVQVVRRGVTRVDRRGPALYLLVDRDDLVMFRLAPVVKKLAWLRPRALRLRIVDRSEEGYVERVLSDVSGRVTGIRREYSPRSRPTLRVVVTDSVSVAQRWSDADDAVSAWRAIREDAGRDAVAYHSVSGRVFDVSSVEQRDAFLACVVDRWRDLPSMYDGVYEYKPGVHLHESVRPSAGVRLVGPLWLGAGLELTPGRVVVGPRVVSDAERAHAVRPPVVWEEMRPPGWRIMPRRAGRRLTLRRVTKRLFDMGFSAGVLAATAPLYPVVMLLILLEDGRPFFFAHTRQTIHGRNFPCLKFRTMRRDAEAMKADLAEANQADGPQFFIEDDPRLLRIGKLLRKFQVDELPQFLNVLAGHMSVVGPRPSPDKENQFCPAWREARLSVRPGVTGLWQVRRTREPQTDFQEWIRYDLEYVQHESWRLDLWIVWQTILKVVRG